MYVDFKYPVTIFRNDYNGRTYYRLGLSKKLQDGSYENGYIDCQFRKNVEILNKMSTNYQLFLF